MERLAAALGAPSQGFARAPGDITTNPIPPAAAAARSDLLALLGLTALPAAMTDAAIVALMTPPVDAATVKAKFRQAFCTPPGEFYCEAERAAWLAENPWCAGMGVIPIITVPVFTSDVERNAWIDTHRHCPVPPPALSNHMCTPGEPGCGPAPAAPASSSGAGAVIMGAAALILVGWLISPERARTNPASDRPSARDRLAGLYQRTLAADAEFSAALRKAYGSNAGDMRYRTQKQTPAVQAAGKRYEDAMADFVKARNELR